MAQQRKRTAGDDLRDFKAGKISGNFYHNGIDRSDNYIQHTSAPRYITDENGKIRESPRRDLVWQAQTPQAFAAELLFPAFEKLMQHSTEGITDDAMVVEQEMGIASVMVKGGYENIKITTPEDLLVAESFLAEK